MRTKLAVLCTTLALTLLALPTLRAQSPAVAIPAPVPSEIFTAKKVFISNAGGYFNPKVLSGGPTRAYDEFYAAIKSGGRYDLVGAPADADLVLEINFSVPIISVYSGAGGASSTSDPHFTLKLLDPKTRITLWTLISHMVPTALTQNGRDKNFDAALSTLVADLKTLTAQPPPPPATN